ncbi:MAG: hypothetical protein AAB834_01775 [Patescibacteria group bacterium]|mgnify:CR=1
MKKLLLGVLVAVFVSAGVASGSASATAPQTDITGVITENHVAVAGANVTVLCNGNTQMDTTDAFGSYLAVFPIAQCPFGVTVKVTAEKDGKSGVATGTVQGITTKLNLAIVNVAIPEYGLIGALAAGSAGIGMIALMRRRQQQMQV